MEIANSLPKSESKGTLQINLQLSHFCRDFVISTTPAFRVEPVKYKTTLYVSKDLSSHRLNLKSTTFRTQANWRVVPKGLPKLQLLSVADCSCDDEAAEVQALKPLNS